MLKTKKIHYRPHVLTANSNEPYRTLICCTETKGIGCGAPFVRLMKDYDHSLLTKSDGRFLELN